MERLRTNKQHNWRPTELHPQVEEFQEAEKIVIKSLQRQHFKKETSVLCTLPCNQDKFKQRQAAQEGNKQVKATSNIYKLDPYLDEDGVLRVVGRLSHANSPTEVKHPMIVPQNSHVTTLMIRYHHGKQHHQGYGMTHNAIRQAGFYIINGKKNTVTTYSLDRNGTAHDETWKETWFSCATRHQKTNGHSPWSRRPTRARTDLYAKLRSLRTTTDRERTLIDLYTNWFC